MTNYPPPSGPPIGQGDTYPSSSAVQPAKKGGCLKWGLIALAAVIVIGVIAAIAGGSSDKKTTSTSKPPSSSSSSSDTGGQVADRHQVGETAHTDDFDVTLNGITDPFVNTSPVAEPKAGNRQLLFDVTALNTSSEDKTFSVLLAFELSDDTGRVFKPTLTQTPQGQLDGGIAAHDKRRGDVVFEVPEGEHGFTLRIKGGLGSGGVTYTVP